MNILTDPTENPPTSTDDRHPTDNNHTLSSPILIIERASDAENDSTGSPHSEAGESSDDQAPSTYTNSFHVTPTNALWKKKL